MAKELTTERVWEAIESELFAVLGMVTARNEARTVGVVYVVHERRLYVATDKDAWKTKHIAGNPHVSITIPIAKRIFFLPWIKIPAATITFSGRARIVEVEETPPAMLQALFRGLETDAAKVAGTCLIEITPEKDFITYGVGMPLLQMRDTEKARGRVPVAPEGQRAGTLAPDGKSRSAR